VKEQHTISILLENEAGSLSRVSGLFSARAYNIESLSVAPTEDPSISRMTIVTEGSPAIIEQITKQLNKLVDVIKLVDLNDGARIERELLLVKLQCSKSEQRAEFKRLADIFSGVIVDITEDSYTIEITGLPDRIDEFIQAAGPRNIMELVRSGVLGLQIGSRSLTA
jgi:acetolactate synthase I/III small subunit